MVNVAPTTLNAGSGGAGVVLPGISVGGLITTAPASVNVSKSGVTATLPSANVAGLANVSATSVSAGKSGVSATLPGANVANVVNVSPTTASVGPSGVSATVSSVSVAGVASISSATVSVNKNGISAVLPGANVANLVSVTPTRASVGPSGISATVSSVTVTGVASISPTTLNVNKNGISATLPGANVANIVNLSPTSVSAGQDGVSVTLPSANVGEVIKIEPPTIKVEQPAPKPSQTTAAQSAINQATPVTQLVASNANSEAMAPVDQIINGMAFSDGTAGSSGPSSCAGLASAAFAPGAELSVSAWNSATFGSSEHSYQVNGGEPGCSAALSTEGLQRTFLPGAVVDASKAFGFKPGTLHFGFSGGHSESDTRVKATDALRTAGFSDTGKTRLTSYSLGGYSLLTMNDWYVGTATGLAWGQVEADNFVLGSTSDYDTSGFVVASFVGKIVPLSDTMRLDVRGTLSFQRTVGDGHVDSVGVNYSDHVIQGADASISARLFGVFRDGDNVLRPFVQAGVTHHLTYENRLEIDGVGYQLHEADTSLFTAAGLDFEVGGAYQFSIGVRHDYSPDQESVTGRIGFTARFN